MVGPQRRGAGRLRFFGWTLRNSDPLSIVGNPGNPSFKAWQEILVSFCGNSAKGPAPGWAGSLKAGPFGAGTCSS